MERPPNSGPGSSAEAWREYAAAVTDSPVDAWANLSRDEIVELLDSEGTPVEAPHPGVDLATPEREAVADAEAAQARAELAEQAGGADDPDTAPDAADTESPAVSAARPAAEPEWMVLTEDGPVPERVVVQQRREEAAKRRARAVRERDKRQRQYERAQD